MIMAADINNHPLMVFANECALGAYSDSELRQAALKAMQSTVEQHHDSQVLWELTLSGKWEIKHNRLKDHQMTDAWCLEHRWRLMRTEAPFEAPDRSRMWCGPTLTAARDKAYKSLGITEGQVK